MAKLNQILAVEHSVKERVGAAFTLLHQETQKPALMNGMTKTYQPREEEGETYPTEHQRVQLTAKLAKDKLRLMLGELLDVTLIKDVSNRSATADIVVSGRAIAQDVPSTFLVWFKKKLVDLRTFFTKMVTVDPALQWNVDGNTPGQRVSDAVQSQRTKKLPRAITLAPATKEHPAQVQMVAEDVVAGTWTTTKFSGAITQTERDEILDRVELLINAVSFALEQANSVQAADVRIGQEVFDYLFQT